MMFLALLNTINAGAQAPATSLYPELDRALRYDHKRVLRTADSLLAMDQSDLRHQLQLRVLRGYALMFEGRLDESMTELIGVHAEADSLGLVDDRIAALLGMASVRISHDDVGRASKDLLMAERLAREYSPGRAYKVWLALGVRSVSMEQEDSAFHWLRKTLSVARAEEDSFVLADAHFNMGIVHGATGRFDSSEHHLNAALAKLPRTGYPYMEGRIYNTLGFLYDQLGDPERATLMHMNALDRARKNSIGNQLSVALQDMAGNQLALGDTVAAWRYLEELIQVRDSIERLLQADKFAEIEARFRLDQIENELALARSAAEVNALRAQRTRYLWAALIMITMLGGSLIYSFHRQARLKQQAAILLERDKEILLEENELLLQENLMARFETLKSQIDPHFLFNAMNTLYTLVETEPEKAREFIASFSALYRKVLGSRERTIVPVQEELELVRHYLFLQRMRFGDSLQVNIDVPMQATKGFLPPFTLQMLLENAIKHNVISATNPLHIRVFTFGDKLLVKNDLRPRSNKEAGTGTGLENIRKRYGMLGAQEPVFSITGDSYVASVPILTEMQ
jgi:tetratricopeptide (TPR) repeat protein